MDHINMTKDFSLEHLQYLLKASLIYAIAYRGVQRGIKVLQAVILMSAPLVILTHDNSATYSAFIMDIQHERDVRSAAFALEKAFFFLSVVIIHPLLFMDRRNLPQSKVRYSLLALYLMSSVSNDGPESAWIASLDTSLSSVRNTWLLSAQSLRI
ncbi:hypothetical protein GUJ93_ZPchr0006g44840 [Zizania palustris]|uniref:Uncharacterized protein n=1 Tax=Zizania palustris TaxID=103762 RepID=A0A8J5W3C3_ZIZPA|nr:hypothetical protein GUJ93_ZPchr0006g44840 [Zizania palustris]